MLSADQLIDSLDRLRRCAASNPYEEGQVTDRTVRGRRTIEWLRSSGDDGAAAIVQARMDDLALAEPVTTTLSACRCAGAIVTPWDLVRSGEGRWPPDTTTPRRLLLAEGGCTDVGLICPSGCTPTSKVPSGPAVDEVVGEDPGVATNVEFTPGFDPPDATALTQALAACGHRDRGTTWWERLGDWQTVWTNRPPDPAREACERAALSKHVAAPWARVSFTRFGG